MKKGKGAAPPVAPLPLPSPPPGFAPANQTEVVTQVVLGHVQAVLERFTESFEWRWQQQDDVARTARSRSPVRKPCHDQTKFKDLSSHKDSDQNSQRKMVSAIRALSPGAEQADRQVVISDSNDATITVSLKAAEEAPAPQASSVDSRTDSCKEKPRKKKHVKRKKKSRRRHSSSSSESVRKERRIDRSADREPVSEPRAAHGPSEQTGAYEAETSGLSASSPLESGARESKARESHSILMEVDVNGDAIPRDQGKFSSTQSFVEVVADQDTPVFRPSPMKAPVSVEQTSHGQLKVAEAPSTVPAKSRPIILNRSGRPVSPAPVSRFLLGSLPEEITQNWQEEGTQCATEGPTSAHSATVTSTMAEQSLTDIELAEDESLEEYFLGDRVELVDEDGPTIEEFMEMGRDRPESDEDIPEGRFSRLDTERKVEARTST